MINFKEYEEAAARTMCKSASWESELVTTALGLAGEAGEFADLVKKWQAQGHPLNEQKLLLELGDVLWYVTLGARALGVSLSHIAELNNQKLKARYPAGFSPEASINREQP